MPDVRRGLGGPLKGGLIHICHHCTKGNHGHFSCNEQSKGDKGWAIKGTIRNGLGKLGFGDTALCSSAIQEKHHSKHPRWQTS
jgi:hypothetical protein